MLAFAMSPLRRTLSCSDALHGETMAAGRKAVLQHYAVFSLLAEGTWTLEGIPSRSHLGYCVGSTTHEEPDFTLHCPRQGLRCLQAGMKALP